MVLIHAQTLEGHRSLQGVRGLRQDTGEGSGGAMPPLHCLCFGTFSHVHGINIRKSKAKQAHMGILDAGKRVPHCWTPMLRLQKDKPH